MKLTQKKIGLSVLALAGALFATATLAEMLPPPPASPILAADADGDGKVTKAEFEAWRVARAASLDADKDGKISAEELVASRMKEAEAQAKVFADRMIARLDLDKDGKLSAAELADAPMPGFDRMDHNQDGVLDQGELTDMRGMQGQQGHHKGGHGKGAHGKGGQMQDGQGPDDQGLGNN